MKFTPEKCRIPDQRMKPFIDADEIWEYLNTVNPDRQQVKDVIAKSLDKKRLSMAETAVLINATDPDLVGEIKEGARTLKERVYGNRIVLFAPLYIGNKCSNNCSYCGFKSSNTAAIRKTLDDQELIREVEALEDNGQKRLILVYGEHRDYSPEFIAHTVNVVYGVKKGHGEIRRVNINAAPLEIEGFRTVKAAGIGTYQIFQETYHPEVYLHYHLGGAKRNYEYRLTSLDRAQEAGIDDVGIGALLGLYDWRFETMGLIRHTNHLEACYNVGPHTISFPRIQEASAINFDGKYKVSDSDFSKMVAILRLAVPYTGMILTARENPELRREVMHFGVSQIDGGTKLEIGAYSDSINEKQDLNREQFHIGDSRSLNEIIDELIDTGYLPSFCTACYRLGRTGEHFMEFSVPGFIKRYCSPNAILTLTEYLEDYAPAETRRKGYLAIEKNLLELEAAAEKIDVPEIRRRIEKIRAGQRDLYF
ncbi:MAG TPA: [FeFe] hydrogenase H-cluster radical SAM maturase HydG [Bacteroidales bacterium]|nr:[FeFe] hydrogenase H-cluster radical SAM maturase HydG [Bacteroidales bacterium]HPT01908.1 [FeFe] hydrogenase H-cluster radical SAM maturase HydG [Bacteroidales bacterium]